MRYALLIYGDQSRRESATGEEIQAVFEAHDAFSKSLADQGVMRGGEGLQPTSAATTVRVRDGERLVTDGPFAETKEQLGGFYLVECESIDEAIETAARVPGATEGSIEIRPLIVYPDAGGSAP
jgi:hypothetical protein